MPLTKCIDDLEGHIEWITGHHIFARLKQCVSRRNDIGHLFYDASTRVQCRSANIFNAKRYTMRIVRKQHAERKSEHKRQLHAPTIISFKNDWKFFLFKNETLQMSAEGHYLSTHKIILMVHHRLRRLFIPLQPGATAGMRTHYCYGSAPH